DGVSLTVQEGETVALLGPSGVGKSVTLKTINGLLRPDTGDVIVDGLHVPKLKRKELSDLRAKIGYVFQYGALFDSMTVAENIRPVGRPEEILASKDPAVQQFLERDLEMSLIQAESQEGREPRGRNV